mmetsp:Transcript_28104/g.58402  ORF Transcript_28104/g.58402 Transcript_28104/m.58402 type:complete len:103 (-) Transcript_28104:966-1274(-)
MPILVSKQFTDFNSIEDNNEGSEIDTISVRINGASSVSSTFFEEHLDLVSEVLSFFGCQIIADSVPNYQSVFVVPPPRTCSCISLVYTIVININIYTVLIFS